MLGWHLGRMFVHRAITRVSMAVFCWERAKLRWTWSSVFHVWGGFGVALIGFTSPTFASKMFVRLIMKHPWNAWDFSGVKLSFVRLFSRQNPWEKHGMRGYIFSLSSSQDAIANLDSSSQHVTWQEDGHEGYSTNYITQSDEWVPKCSEQRWIQIYMRLAFICY